ncbi:MAG TPA: hypothetical protein VHB20_02000 [Verrucomicrobiae bacterium]|jgi:hypothetical protein|nr:hypothetical protein [Verrucomicrobiae bacterium]
MANSGIVRFSGGAITAIVGVAWYLYIPTHIRNRIAAGKEAAAAEAKLIKGNRTVAFVLVATGLVDILS